MADATQPGTGGCAVPETDEVLAAVQDAAALVCTPDVSRERLRAAAAAATARAFDPCVRRECATCDRWWADSGLLCEARQVRRLGKHLAQAFLPILRRGCTLGAALPALTDAAARALAAPPGPLSIRQGDSPVRNRLFTSES